MKAAILALVLCSSAPAFGQGLFMATPAQLEAIAPQAVAVQTGEQAHDFSLASETGRKVANVASWVTVGAEGAVYGVNAWKAEDRKRSVLCTLGELATTSASVRIIKAIVGRERPDHSDNRSFPSGHTAFAALMQGAFRGDDGKHWRALLWPLAVGSGRVLARKHYPTDVMAGAALGWAISWAVCPAGVQ